MRGNCPNPECRNGLTPGVSIAGKGNAKVPIIGAKQHWAWVRCLACNAPEDAGKAGARYRPIKLTEDDIARRAQLATIKAPYDPVGSSSLAGLKRPGAPQPAASTASSEQMTKMLEQISQLNQTVMKLTNQVGDLLEENRTLRKQLEARAVPPPTQAAVS